MAQLPVAQVAVALGRAQAVPHRPQSVSVVTQAQIRDQAMQGVADSLRYVPGVGVAQGEGNRDTPIFRGSSSTADLFIDGIRDDVQYFRDLYNIESVEVLKGPNAMIFGRGGSGGVLNRVGKQAEWHDRRELRRLVDDRHTSELAGHIVNRPGTRPAPPTSTSSTPASPTATRPTPPTVTVTTPVQPVEPPSPGPAGPAGPASVAKPLEPPTPVPARPVVAPDKPKKKDVGVYGSSQTW